MEIVWFMAKSIFDLSISKKFIDTTIQRESAKESFQDENFKIKKEKAPSNHISGLTMISYFYNSLLFACAK